MKVFDLRCPLDHRFEGWFSSDEDYVGQQQKGLLTCPMCDSPQIDKLPSAPRLNLGNSTTREPEQRPAQSEREGTNDVPVPSTGTDTVSVTQMQSMWLQMARHVMANTEDVGKAFAAEARKMHHGETPERPIRGQATPKEARQLQEEGIDVLQLPLPSVAKETLQ